MAMAALYRALPTVPYCALLCYSFQQPFVLEKPERSAYRTDAYGYSRMTVYNSTHVFWEQVRTVHDSTHIFWEQVCTVYNSTLIFWEQVCTVHSSTHIFWEQVRMVHDSSLIFWEQVRTVRAISNYDGSLLQLTCRPTPRCTTGCQTRLGASLGQCDVAK